MTPDRNSRRRGIGRRLGGDEALPVEPPQPAVEPPTPAVDHRASAVGDGSVVNVPGPSSPPVELATVQADDPEAQPVRGWPPGIGDEGSWRSHPVTLLSNPPHRPAVALDFGRIGSLEVRAASIRGQSHRYSAQSHLAHARHDEYGVQATADGRWLVIVVADGVTNTQLPHRAAPIAVRVAARVVVAELENGTLPSDIGWADAVAPAVSTAIVREAAKAAAIDLPNAVVSSELLRQLQAQMATTAICAVVSAEPDGDGGPSFTVANLAGDSAAYLLSVDGWSQIGAPEDEEDEFIATTAVSPLPAGQESIAFLQSGVIARGTSIFLMTDGLSNPLGQGRGVVGRYLHEEWLHPPDIYTFAGQLDLYRRTFDDDRACVGVWFE